MNRHRLGSGLIAQAPCSGNNTLGVAILAAWLCIAGFARTSRRQVDDASASSGDGMSTVPSVQSNPLVATGMRFISPDGDFEVALPATPVQVDDSVSTPIGMQPVTRFKVVADGCELDAGFLKRSANVLARVVGEDSILDSACKGTATHMGGEVVASTKLTLAGHHAREITIGFDSRSASTAVARLIITDEPNLSCHCAPPGRAV